MPAWLSVHTSAGYPDWPWLLRGQLELEQLLLETYKLSLNYIKSLIELHTKAGKDITSHSTNIQSPLLSAQVHDQWVVI